MTAAATVQSAGPISSGRRSHHPLCAIGAVLLGSFLVGFQVRLFSIGLADLKGALSLSFDEGAWLSTAATAPQILVAPMIAWLATVFGVRRILSIPSLVYALASLLVPLSRDYQTLLVLHVVQGMLLGAFIPATIMIILRNLPVNWWLPAIGLYAFRSAFTLNYGVSLVGFYTQTAGWQWLYWQNALLAPLMGLLVTLGAPHERVNRNLLRRADWGGMLLFGSGLAMLYVALDQGNRLDWLESGTIVPLLAGGGVLLVAFLVNEALVAEPWANVSVILSHNVVLTLTIVLLFTITSLSNTTLMPNFLTVVGQLRPEQIGPLLLYYVAAPLAVLTAVAVFLLRRIDSRYVLIAGFAAFAAAGLLGTHVTHDWRAPDFVPIALLQAVGQGFTFIAIIVTAFANINPARATSFAAYIQVARLGGAELGAALMVTVLRVREQLHSNLLGQHLASGDQDVAGRLAALTGNFVSHGMGTATMRGISSLAAAVQREANVLAYIDGFWLTFWAAIAGLVVVSLLKAPPPGPLVPRHGMPSRAVPVGSL